MKARKKLNNRSGFTLAETLLAVLILLLVSGIVATGVPAAKNAYLKVVVGSNAQALLSTTAAALRDELGSAWSVKNEGTDIVSYYSSDTGAISELDCSGDNIQLREYVTVTGFNEGAGSYEGQAHPLVSKKAATKDLKVSCHIHYNEASGVVEVTDLVVKNTENTELAALPALMIRVFSAVPTTAP